MLKITNIVLPLDYTENDLEEEVTRRLKTHKEKIQNITLDKRETLKGEDGVKFKVSVLVTLEEALEDKLSLVLRKKGVTKEDVEEYTPLKVTLPYRPVVVGFGPAGIFASLSLALAGARPIVIERGEDTEARIKSVQEFMSGGCLNSESNILFGEGGAGAFSDGKLKVGHKDKIKRFILNALALAGADESILYLEKPHVGSDVLHRVIVNLRKKIIELGGEVCFNSKLVRIETDNKSVARVIYESGGKEEKIETSGVILAIGHSARDTIEYLFSSGVEMEAKGFGIGVRIEHPQSLINEIEYTDPSLAEKLGSADYKMVVHLEGGRTLYTFCMCPGGFVMPSSSEENMICTNGMSEFARDGDNANTALLVSVTPDDFPSKHPLAGIEFQREIERRAFTVAGGDYSAPIIKLSDFLQGVESDSLGSVKPTYRPKTVFLSPDKYLPDFVCETLRRGIREMCEYKKGYYYPDAILTGPETRTTSPVRMTRGDTLEATGFSGLFPSGEGAGYAGGIISSAYDGILCAEKLLEKEKRSIK